jgi:extracellular factor (EF) 3-hydroxypalmitic acid methyl ester biosynthesis protein
MQILSDRQSMVTLLAKIQDYRKRSLHLQQALRKNPSSWGRYQSEFNQELNGVFRDLMVYVQTMESKGKAVNVERLKLLFVEKLRKYFIHGDYVAHSLKKPRGYAGDYQIIDAIYQNNPRTVGYDRLFDNYFQMSAVSIAVRNRKDDFKKIILNVAANKKGPIRVLNLASGPAREIHEALKSPALKDRDIFFDCVEQDQGAIDFAKCLIDDPERTRFIKQNVSRIALKSNIESTMKDRYDLIYSTGLFDYLDYRLSLRLIRNLKRLLKPDGVLAISDVRDRFTNPSIFFMEWVGDWNLLYRDDDTFRGIFMDAGFEEQNLISLYEQQGLFQYVIASDAPAKATKPLDRIQLHDRDVIEAFQGSGRSIFQII